MRIPLCPYIVSLARRHLSINVLNEYLEKIIRVFIVVVVVIVAEVFLIAM